MSCLPWRVAREKNEREWGFEDCETKWWWCGYERMEAFSRRNESGERNSGICSSRPFVKFGSMALKLKQCTALGGRKIAREMQENELELFALFGWGANINFGLGWWGGTLLDIGNCFLHPVNFLKYQSCPCHFLF